MFFSTIFHPFGTLFWFVGLKKKGQIGTSEVKNDNNSKFSVNSRSKIFSTAYIYHDIYAHPDFRQKFLSKLFNPQMGILTQSQIKFLEKSNFQNCLNQQMLAAGGKKCFFEKPNLTTLL